MGNAQSSDDRRVSDDLPWSPDDACSACQTPCEERGDFGFTPKGGPLVGTFKPYDLHVVVSTELKSWPARPEFVPGGTVSRIKSSFGSIKFDDSVLITYSDLAPATFDTLELLIFPDLIRVAAPSTKYLPEISQYLQSIGVPNKAPYLGDFPDPPADVTVTRVTQSYLFVCTHKNRNERCGLSGPPLIDAFNASIEKHGLQDSVVVAGSSHFGGHKYAGVVIAYPSGDWYGRLKLCDADVFIREQFVEKRILKPHWRGRYGLRPTELY